MKPSLTAHSAPGTSDRDGREKGETRGPVFLLSARTVNG